MFEVNLVKVLDQTPKLEEKKGKRNKLNKTMRKQEDKSRMSDIQEKITLDFSKVAGMGYK